METPKTNRTLRTPTPRLSDRKKKLFETDGDVLHEEDILYGITALDTGAGIYDSGCITNNQGHSESRTTRRSLHFRKSAAHSSTEVFPANKNKENICATNTIRDDELESLFSHSMQFNNDENDEPCPEEDAKMRDSLKRVHDQPRCDVEDDDISPNKLPKPNSPVETMCISTKAFYSEPKSPKADERYYRKATNDFKSVKASSLKARSRERLYKKNIINKGVKHKIRKPSGFAGTRISSALDVDDILSKLHNEKLRNLIKTKRAEKEQIENVHRIFRNNNNPIAMARPLSVLLGTDDANNNKSTDAPPLDVYKHCYGRPTEADFSDIDEFDDSNDNLMNPAKQDSHDNIENIPDAKPPFPSVLNDNIGVSDERVSNRKFFKSGQATSTRKEVKITDHIRASVCNGKISLVQREKRNRPKPQYAGKNVFSAEQATVDQILKNLDDSTCIDTLNDSGDASKANEPTPKAPHCEPQQHIEETSNIRGDHAIEVVTDKVDFRMRLPYNTVDPELISQQKYFLDFLIENNICNEDTFDIFIANYDDRFKEAEEIVKNVTGSEPVMPSNDPKGSTVDETQNRNDPVLSEVDDVAVVSEIVPDQRETFEEPSTSKAVANAQSQGGKLFPIFSRDSSYRPLSSASQHSTRKLWTGGSGANQYQIDAGQRNYGASQCKQCGLVYSVHEPEEEKLHKEFHASLHILRFKGWIDEDIVAVYPEWGVDGRILRVTESSNIKRRERLTDLLKIVDKELGFSSYIVPQTFTAYLAVRKCQIVGICLVQPLTKANKYICVNGVDCCTEEEFEVKCGVSRIWVSPLHRRLHIASKLIQAVQTNTIFGVDIPINNIAFSAPTEAGKIFAQKVTGLENFFVYQ